MKVKTISVIWAPSKSTGSHNSTVKGELGLKGAVIPGASFGTEYIVLTSDKPTQTLRTYDPPVEADFVVMYTWNISYPHTLLVNDFKVALPVEVLFRKFEAKLNPINLTWLVLGAIVVIVAVALIYKKA